MADSRSDLSNRLRILTECTVCLGMINEPRQLPCGHAFCSSCLNDCLVPPEDDQELISWEDDGVESSNLFSQSLICPECETEHHLTEVTLESSFPNDVQILRLIIADLRQDRSERRSRCDHSDSSVVCRRCKTPVCAGCMHRHNQGAICRSAKKLKKLQTEVISFSEGRLTILDQKMMEWRQSYESLCQIEEEVQKEYDDIQQDLERGKKTMVETIGRSKENVERMIIDLDEVRNVQAIRNTLFSQITEGGTNVTDINLRIDEIQKTIEDVSARLRVDVLHFEFKRDEQLKEVINNYGSRLKRRGTSMDVLSDDIEKLCDMFNSSLNTRQQPHQ